MPRSKKTTITKEKNTPQVKQGVIGRMTGDVLEFHGQSLKEEILKNSEEYNLDESQTTNVFRLIDAITIKSKDAALRQVISLFKS